MRGKGLTLSLPSLSYREWRLPGAGWLLLPAILLVAAGFLYPTITVLSRSFSEPPGGTSHYNEFLGSPSLMRIMGRSMLTAGIVTVVSLAVAYPYAYVAATSTKRAARILLLVMAIALFISVIVRAYSWLAILDRNGVLNSTLEMLGLGRFRVTLVHNFAGVLIGMIQYGIPFMTLPIYAVMRRFDERLRYAAAALGARPVRAFWFVYLPLTLPGVVAGCAIVFITTLGYYIIPSILGGPQNTMVGQLIATKIQTTLEWGLGAAIGSVLLMIALVTFVVFYRTTRRFQGAGAGV